MTLEIAIYAFLTAIGIYASAYFLFSEIYDLIVKVAKKVHGDDVLHRPFDKEAP